MKTTHTLSTLLLALVPTTMAGAADADTARLVDYAGRFHPIAVHLPIALLLGALLAELLFMLTGRDRFRCAARFNLHLGIMGAVVAIPLGLAAAHGVDYPVDYARSFVVHRALGLGTLGWAVAAAFLLRRTQRTGAAGPALAYRAVLAAGVATVLFAGHFGATLIYGPGYLSW